MRITALLIMSALVCGCAHKSESPKYEVSEWIGGGKRPSSQSFYADDVICQGESAKRPCPTVVLSATSGYRGCMARKGWLYSPRFTASCTHIQGQVSAGSYREIVIGSSFFVSSFFVVDSGSLALTERHIQDLIRGQLVSRGFTEAEDPEEADLAIAYSYSVGAGQTVVSSNPDFVWGGQKVTSTTSHPRHFEISVVDVQASREQDEVVFAWQAEIYIQGSSQNMSWLAEHFVPELFKYFGQSATNRQFSKNVVE